MEDEQDFEARFQGTDNHIVATPHAVVISLSDENQRKAQECLKNSGEITFSLREVTVTKLSGTRLANNVYID